MRIGQLMLERGWVNREALTEALAVQPASGTRLCSLLIERGAIEFDDAARALGEQHGCAAVMKRHLEGRDRGVEAMLPSRVARNLVAIPIGRLGSGALIVCVRDPARSTLATLTGALGEAPVIAVAPARWVERLVARVYAPRDSVDIPFDDEETPPPPPPPPPKMSVPRTISVVVPKLAAAARDSLDGTLATFRDIDDVNWLFDVAMKYVATRWRSALLLALKEKRAIGVRGHGISATATRTFVIEIAEVAIVERARTERRLIEIVPDEPGSEHRELIAVVGLTPMVAPLGERHVLAVGDPLDGDRESAAIDLGLLAEAMTEALARM
jgi:hypothetical protein